MMNTKNFLVLKKESQITDNKMMLGELIVAGITERIKLAIKCYGEDYGEVDDWMQVIVNAKPGLERYAAKEALRMALIDYGFVEVDDVIL